MAANISYNKLDQSFKPCLISIKLSGKKATHPIFKCDKFSSNKVKISKLKEFKGCTRCSNLNHISSNCKYRFKNCPGYYFTFLCSKNQNDDNENNSKATNCDKNDLSANTTLISYTVALKNDNMDNNFLLPIFTCDIKNQTIRVLKVGDC